MSKLKSGLQWMGKNAAEAIYQNIIQVLAAGAFTALCLYLAKLNWAALKDQSITWVRGYGNLAFICVVNLWLVRLLFRIRGLRKQLAGLPALRKEADEFVATAESLKKTAADSVERIGALTKETTEQKQEIQRLKNPERVKKDVLSNLGFNFAFIDLWNSNNGRDVEFGIGVNVFNLTGAPVQVGKLELKIAKFSNEKPYPITVEFKDGLKDLDTIEDRISKKGASLVPERWVTYMDIVTADKLLRLRNEYGTVECEIRIWVPSEEKFWPNKNKTDDPHTGWKGPVKVVDRNLFHGMLMYLDKVVSTRAAEIREIQSRMNAQPMPKLIKDSIDHVARELGKIEESISKMPGSQ